MKTNNFEESVSEINKLIYELETGEVSLDDSISKYSEAMKLIAGCHAMLEKAEGKIKKVTMEKNKIKIDDFE